MKNVMMILGVLTLMDFLGKWFMKSLGNKRFLFYTISLVSMMLIWTVITMFFYGLYALQSKALHFTQLNLLVIICAVIILLIAYLCFRKYTKKNNRLKLKDYLQSFLGQMWLASIIIYLTVLSFAGQSMKLIKPISPIVQFGSIILSLSILIFSFIRYSEATRILLTKKLLEDVNFPKQIAKQKSDGGFIIEGKKITPEFMYLLDFGIYQVLNRNTLINIKHDETAFVQVSNEAIRIYEKLSSQSSNEK